MLFSFQASVIYQRENCHLLSFVDLNEAVADVGKVGTQSWILVPAIAHQLNHLNIVGRVVGWDKRTKRRCLASSDTNANICSPSSKHNYRFLHRTIGGL